MRRSLALITSLPLITLGLGLGACSDPEQGTDNALLVTASGSIVFSLAGIEGGQPIAVGVLLDSPPSAPMVVTLAVDPLVTLDRTTLTFTAADFDQPQPVVITPVDDANVIDGAGEITLTAAGLDSLVIPIAIADDDHVAIVGAPADVLIPEGGSASFGIALGADPGGPVTITVASSNAAKADPEQVTLTFAADWAVPQTVTVIAPNDTDALDEDVTINFGGLHAVAATVPVVVLDRDRQNFVISPTGLNLTEGGAAGSFTVRLTQPPTGSLAIAVTSTNPAIATVSPATLTFTAASFMTPQTVTISPRADVDGTADASTVLLASTGLRDRTVAITVAEDATVDVPDVTGDFLMTIAPGFGPDISIRYRVTYTIDPITATLGYSATALRVDDGQPIGDPIAASGVLAEDTSFAGDFDGLLPGDANPFSGAAAAVDAVKLGRIVGADLLCGTMTGTAQGVPLDGTTWGAVRITGTTLPVPVVACPN